METNYSILYWAQRYICADISVIPVTFGKKAPPPKGWRSQPLPYLWHNITGEQNLAIRVGHHNIFLLDPDRLDAQDHVKNYLDGLGVKPYQVQTASGRKHSYLRTQFPDDIKTNGKLRVGPGDWRGRNGYGLAAPSIVDGRRYYSLNDSLVFPEVDFRDIAPLLVTAKKRDASRKSVSQSSGSLEEWTDPIIPVRLLKRDVPRWLYNLGETLARAEPGKPVKMLVKNEWKEWTSRSEAYFSGAMSLVLHGHIESDDVCSYIEVPGKSRAWHESAFLDAIDVVVNTSWRPWLADLYNANIAFPGRTGVTDMKVFRAIVSLAWIGADISAFLTHRDIMMLAAITRSTVNTSLSRLEATGLLERSKNGSKNTKFRLCTEHSLLQELLRNEPKDTEGEGNSFGTVLRKLPNQELFRRGALLAGSEAVFMVLSDQPLSVKKIASITKRHPSSTARYLNCLKAEGVAKKVKEGWVLCDELTSSEEKYHCAEASQKRALIIQSDRERYYQQQRDYRSSEPPRDS